MKIVVLETFNPRFFFLNKANIEIKWNCFIPKIVLKLKLIDDFFFFSPANSILAILKRWASLQIIIHGRADVLIATSKK